MLEPLPNYDNWKTAPDDAPDFDGYDEWLALVDQRCDEERDAELQEEATR